MPVGVRTDGGVAPLAAAWFLLLLQVPSSVLWLLQSTFGWDVYLLLAYSVGATLLLLAGYEWRRAGHPLTPMGILALAGLLLFVLRPLSVHATGQTTAGARAQTRMFTGVTVDAAAVSLMQVAVFYFVLGLAYLLITARQERHPKPGTPIWVSAEAQEQRAAMLLFLTIVIALATTLLLIQSSGGLIEHFTGVQYRSESLQGRYFLTLGYIPLGVALVVYVTTHRNAGGAWNLLSISGMGVLLVAALTTGGRGPLLLGAILPLLVLQQTSSRPLRTPSVLAVGVALVAGAMVMSLTLRENAYTGGAAVAALSADPVQVLLDRLTSGAETRPFDSLILLNEMHMGGQLDWQYGRTYLAVVTWFLPGSLVPWQKGGANTWFTEEYLPDFYYPFRIETSISAIGEAYANFSWWGIFLVAAITGWAAAALSMHQTDATLRGTVLYAVLTPLFFSFVRGDSYHNVSMIGFTAVIAVVIVKLVQDPGRRERPANQTVAPSRQRGKP